MKGPLPELAVHEVGGTGPLFVLVHGFTGSSRDFAEVAPALTDVRRVALIDQLGHGASPRATTYSYAALSAAIEAALDRLGEPADLLGHSLGGRVVLPLAVTRPDVVRSLIVMDGWADQPDRGEPGRLLAQALARGDTLGDALHSFEAQRDMREQELLITTRGLAWHDARLAANAAGFDEAAFAQLAPLVFVSGDEVLDECATIGCPTTVLVGEHDTPFAGPSRRLAARIPGAELVTIEGAFHSPQLTHPEGWSAAVRHHLGGVDAIAAS